MKIIKKLLMLVLLFFTSFSIAACDLLEIESEIVAPKEETVNPNDEENGNDVESFIIIWKNYDGTTLEVDTEVLKNENPSYDGDTPTRASNQTFDYEFVGWGPTVSPVTEDAVYIAQYQEVFKKYEIKWEDTDGTLLYESNVEYGVLPVYKGETPQKDSVNGTQYHFVGWTPNITSATKNQVYTAQYEESLRTYEITWKDAENNILGTTNVEHGEMPTYNLPANTEEWNYTGWYPQVQVATENRIYVASREYQEYLLTFYNEDGNFIETFTLVYNSDIYSQVDEPTKTGYVFDGWYTEDGERIGSTQKINRDLILYAKFTVDYVSLINHIQRETIRANVKIEVENYNTNMFGVKTENSLSQGSGVIYKEVSGIYYLLTNNHVAALREGFQYIEYTIIDYKGVRYDGYLYNDARDPNYDLAVLYFTKVDDLYIIPMAENNPEIGDEVISLGQPQGQNNAVTFGEVIRYRIPVFQVPDPTSTTDFPSIFHNAPILSGSSGGALINLDLILVGVNFAGAVDEQINEGYAIPILKVYEFLEIYGP